MLLYPTVSDWWNSRTQTRAIADYEEALEGMDEADYQAEFDRADAYNAALRSLESPLINYEELSGCSGLSDYAELLDVTGNGIIGYLTVPKLKLELPIYHGTASSTLNVAVGHLQGTSLPVGGEGTHAVLSAHRGLPSAKLFSNLDKLTEGDTFSIRVLNRTLTYEVDQIRIVKPEDVTELAIQEGKDYCTLLTCTPYGVNTERLLVRGVRIPNPKGNETEEMNDAYELDPVSMAPLVAAPLLLILLIALLVRYRRKK